MSNLKWVRRERKLGLEFEDVFCRNLLIKNFKKTEYSSSQIIEFTNIIYFVNPNDGFDSGVVYKKYRQRFLDMNQSCHLLENEKYLEMVRELNFKLFFDIKNINKEFVLSQFCGNTNCVNPEHNWPAFQFEKNGEINRSEYKCGYCGVGGRKEVMNIYHNINCAKILYDFLETRKPEFVKVDKSIYKAFTNSYLYKDYYRYIKINDVYRRITFYYANSFIEKIIKPSSYVLFDLKHIYTTFHAETCKEKNLRFIN